MGLHPGGRERACALTVEPERDADSGRPAGPRSGLRRAAKYRALVRFLRILARCPPGWRAGAAGLLGSGWRRIAPRRRRIAAANLAYCFPELTGRERAALLDRHFLSLGFALVEIALAWYADPAVLRELVRVDGREHLDAALARGRGALLLSGHFTAMEIGGARLAIDSPVDAVYRPHDDPTMERASGEGRYRYRLEGRLIDRRDVRGLLRRLRSNQAVWYAPDQDMGLRHAVFAPFFGRPAATLTATARIARASGAPVLPFFVDRRVGGRAYRAVIEPALAGFPSGDESADAARVNGIIERWARERPEQYLWVHRRFKTRPPGEPDLYGG